MSVKKRTSCGCGAFVRVLWKVLFFSVCFSSVLPCFSADSRQWDGPYSREFQRAPETVIERPLRLISGVFGAVTPDSGVVNVSRTDAYGARPQFQTQEKNVFWRSRNGEEYSAIVFYPTSAPPLGTPFSAVIFSHGLGTSAEDFSYLGRAWASRGVVTLLLRHPNSDSSVWRGKVRPMSNLKEAYRKYWSGRDRAVEISSAIDFIYTSHRDGGLMRTVDLGRIAVAGNDLGALGALLVAGQLPPDNGPSLYDPRISAVLALSPPIFCEPEQGPEVYARISVPLMVISGTRDDGVVGNTKASQRRLLYDSVKSNDRYLVVLKGGDHRVYGGRRMAQQSSDSSFHETISRETSDYWSAYLQGDYAVLTSLRNDGFVSPFNNATVEKTLRSPFYQTNNVDSVVRNR